MEENIIAETIGRFQIINELTDLFRGFFFAVISKIFLVESFSSTSIS